MKHAKKQTKLSRLLTAQSTLEFTFGMIATLVLVSGMIKVFLWAGNDLANRRIAHESYLLNMSDPEEQVNPDFYTSSDIDATVDSDIYKYNISPPSTTTTGVSDSADGGSDGVGDGDGDGDTPPFCGDANCDPGESCPEGFTSWCRDDCPCNNPTPYDPYGVHSPGCKSDGLEWSWDPTGCSIYNCGVWKAVPCNNTPVNSDN